MNKLSSSNRHMRDFPAFVVKAVFSVLMAIAMVLGASFPASAQTTYTWAGPSTGGSWTVTGSWTHSGGSGTTFPSSSTDIAALGDTATATRKVTLGTSESIATLTFTQTSTGTNALLIGGTSNTTLTLANSLTIGGNTTGTELVYLDNIDNTGGTANITDSGTITVGTHGILELGSTGAKNPTVTGTLEVMAGGVLNLDQATLTGSTVQYTVASPVTLDSGSVVNMSAANSGGVTVAAGTNDTRWIINNNFVSLGGTFTVSHATSTTTTNDIYFGGGISSAAFDTGTTGASLLTSINYSGTNVNAGSVAFALTSDVSLPNITFISGATTSSTVNVTIGAVTSGGTLTTGSIQLSAPTNTSSHNGTIELSLTSNVSSGNDNATSPHAGETLIWNTNGFTLDQSSYAGAFTSGAVGISYVIEGGGNLKASYFTLSGNTATGSNGTQIIGATTLIAAGGTALTDDLGNAVVNSSNTIDPLSTFEYTGTTNTNENFLTSNRQIGRLLVGDSTHAATLGISTTATLNGTLNTLGVGGDITVAAHGTLDLYNENVTELATTGATSGGLSGSGTVTNSVTSGASTLTLDTTHGNGSFSGLIQDGLGQVSVTKTGTGTQTFSGNNTYTGATTVNGGTLLVSGSTASGSAVSVNSGGTLSVTGTVNGAISLASGGILSGVGHIGALTVTGGSIINLQDGATNTLHGSTLTFTTGTGNGVISIDVGSGTSSDVVSLSGLASLGSNVFTVNVNSLAGASTGTAYTFISATGGLTLGDFTAGTLTGTLAGDTLSFSGGGTAVTVTINASSSTPASAYFNGTGSDINTAGDFDATVSGSVANTSVVGSTTNVFFSANRNTLTTASTSGTLTVNSLNFGVGTGVNSGITVSGTSAITITGSAVNGNTAGSGITTTGTGSDSISAPVVLGASQTWTVDTGGTLTVSGSISGSGYALSKAGAGILVLTGTNTYSGGTTISAGTLQIGAGGSGATIGSGAISNSGTLVFDLTNNYTLTNNISGNGTLLDIGSGLLTLSGSNTSTGATTVATGTLSFGSTGSLSSGAISLAGGTGLQYTGTSSGTLAQNITVTGSGTVGTLFNTGGQLLTLTGTLTKNGTTLDFGSGKFVVAGTITGSAAHSDVVLGTPTGSTTVGLTSANTYNGPTTIYNGSTLLTGTVGALPTTTPSDVTLGSGTDGAVTNTLDLLGTSQIVNSITASGTNTTVNQIISSNGSASTATVGSGASGTTGNLTVSYSGTTTDSYTGSLGGSGAQTNFSLTKTGTGALALTNANTYTGGTTVSAGTLIVSNTTGSATGSGSLTLSNGANLQGTGAINASTATISGTLTAGLGGLSTTGSLTLNTTGTATFASTAKLVFNLASTAGVDNQLNVGSSAVLFSGSTLTLNLVNSGTTNYTSGSQYILVDGTSNSQYSGLTLSGTTIIGGLTLNLTGTATNGSQNAVYYGNSFLFLNNGDIEVQVVPEPGTWALMLGGLALLVICQRRRRTFQD